MDKGFPVGFTTWDWQTVPEVFRPVKKSVLQLFITECSDSRTTSKLPTLMLSNLVLFGIAKCNRMVIHKNDFSVIAKLRAIAFVEVTIERLEVGSFTDLPDLMQLSLELVWLRHFTEEYVAHLLRFHCDWIFMVPPLKQNPILISSKEKFEIYRIGKQYGKIAFSGRVITVPVNCARLQIWMK